jgi:hypothetical protein
MSIVYSEYSTCIDIGVVPAAHSVRCVSMVAGIGTPMVPAILEMLRIFLAFDPVGAPVAGLGGGEAGVGGSW